MTPNSQYRNTVVIFLIPLIFASPESGLVNITSEGLDKVLGLHIRVTQWNITNEAVIAWKMYQTVIQTSKCLNHG